MKEEIWVYITGFNNYLVSNLGRVKSIKDNKEKILKPRYSKRKYERVNLYIKSKPHTFYVHTLVAKNFIPNEDKSKTTVNHINGIKTDNRVDNLEWLSNLENLKHAFINNLHLFGEKHPMSKLSNEEISEIRKLYFNKQKNQVELSKIYKVTQGHISRLIRNEQRIL